MLNLRDWNGEADSLVSTPPQKEEEMVDQGRWIPVVNRRVRGTGESSGMISFQCLRIIC